jgi:hypothetical protein
MTPEEFRTLALQLPEAVEGSQMGHADFRVGGKVFASLGYPDAGWGMVKLEAEDQAVRVETAPEVFSPASGAWGRQGSTMVRLEAADTATVTGALRAAWRRSAPRLLVAAYAPD